MIRIWADFNAQGEDGRVWLHLPGSQDDIDKHPGELKEGMTVMLYVPDELEVCGTLVFDERHGTWEAIPDWSTIRYYDDATEEPNPG